jgi:hypothetical protein
MPGFDDKCSESISMSHNTINEKKNRRDLKKINAMDLIDLSLVNNNNDKTKKVGLHMCLYMLTVKERKGKRKNEKINRCLCNHSTIKKYFGLFPIEFLRSI